MATKKKAAKKPAGKSSAAPAKTKPAAAKPPATTGQPNWQLEEDVSLERLHTDPANARLHGEANISSIMGSLRSYGQVEPLLVQKSSGRIIGGNGRFEAMRLLGWSRAKVAWLDCDDLFATGLGITLNRTAEKAEWDFETLGKLVGELQAGGIDMGELGWTPDDLAPILAADWSPGDTSLDGHERGDKNDDEGPHSIKLTPEQFDLFDRITQALVEQRGMAEDLPDAERVVLLCQVVEEA